MTTFVGFSTVNQYKKFTLTDFNLIQRDILNAFNIRQGTLPGRPAYGTIMWDFVFENQLQELQKNIEAEVQRVIAGDPRVQISQLNVFPQENGFLIQVQVTVVPTTNSEILSIFFDLQQRQASYV
jgi:phage baseplate assembly protein W